MIHPGISPNLEKDDIRLTLSLLFQARKRSDKKALRQLSEWFSNKYFTNEVYLTNAGRSALYLLLKSAGIKKGDEVIVQAFSCIAAVEPIIWLGAKPVYADIEEGTYNIDPVSIHNRLSKKTKAIIVQHTFGIPAEIKEIEKISSHHSLILIEDCAHSLGATVDNINIGSFGDASYFSFGRDKVISSVSGGAAIIHQPSKFKSANFIYGKFKNPPEKWINQQLMHPLVTSVALFTYNIYLGKLLLYLSQKFKILNKPYSIQEFKSKKPIYYPAKLPESIAALAFNQINKLEKFNKKRTETAKKYGLATPGAIYLRYPMLADNRKKILEKAKKQNIYLGNWYSNLLDPKETDLKKFRYSKGSCPIAEKTSKKIINLPTYPRMSEEDIGKIINLISV